MYLVFIYLICFVPFGCGPHSSKVDTEEQTTPSKNQNPTKSQKSKASAEKETNKDQKPTMSKDQKTDTPKDQKPIPTTNKKRQKDQKSPTSKDKKRGSSQSQKSTTSKEKKAAPLQVYRQGSNQPNEWLSRFLDAAKSAPSRRARKAMEIVLKDPARFRFQLLITEADFSTNPPTLTPHEYRVDQEYFYPASAIKTYASVAALMYYKEQKDQYPWLTTNDALGYSAKRCILKDKTNLKGKLVSLEHEIKKTQLVSNNKAFNRIFNVVGSVGIHQRLLKYFPSIRVYHRLSSNETYEECLNVPAIRVCDFYKDKLHPKQSFTRKRIRSKKEQDAQPTDFSDPYYPKMPAYTGYGKNEKSLYIGKGYVDMKTKKRINKPYDFSVKNRASFYDFQRLTLAIFKPNWTDPFLPSQSPNLNTLLGKTWLNELRHAMTIYPRHSENPIYKSRSLSETRFKPLIRGIRSSYKARKHSLSDDNLYYLNKAGKAFGFHIENAFIGYGKNVGKINGRGYNEGRFKRGLFITVGVYANQDEILNNNLYQYKTITVPVLDAIGYAVGQYLAGQL